METGMPDLLNFAPICSSHWVSVSSSIKQGLRQVTVLINYHSFIHTTKMHSEFLGISFLLDKGTTYGKNIHYFLPSWHLHSIKIIFPWNGLVIFLVSYILPQRELCYSSIHDGAYFSLFVFGQAQLTCANQLWHKWWSVTSFPGQITLSGTISLSRCSPWGPRHFHSEDAQTNTWTVITWCRDLYDLGCIKYFLIIGSYYLSIQ